ncbi:MAG TPA: His/Gly/Thr/Pro-type tRNA ligase C-terminal domain-containing protein [Patescibacteria group bacterium]|nr:His/Gly/Thr/Pro-type tRNA ligase C-terminal domain-containing protein [Patescibacteria group bacterium]
MLQSQLFTKTKKEFAKDEESINAKLLIKAGYIDKLAAGIYSFLPLGLRVLVKIENIIREEMNAVGCQEILMPALHPKENWEKTGRWDSIHDILFKLEGVRGSEFTLGPTHEEVVTPLVKQFVFSYKDLPFAVYQIQSKFRNEARAKSGLLRGREFRMKDVYSFHTDERDLNEFYEKMAQAYERVWERLSLGAITYKTFASGGSFSKYSHEYQTVCTSGEDEIYLCEKCRLAINKEIIAEQDSCPQCGNKELVKKNGIEVGNIFQLKTKYSEPFKLMYQDEKGENKLVQMGCYGIGPSRLMGTIVEVFHDEDGIIWPESVAPFKYHLLNLSKEGKVKKQADELYDHLIKKGAEVLYDDRTEPTPGAKLKDADLLGLPIRLVVSDKTDGKVEVKTRNSTETTLKGIKEIF